MTATLRPTGAVEARGQRTSAPVSVAGWRGVAAATATVRFWGGTAHVGVVAGVHAWIGAPS
jgi:spore maturation protein SpmB